jgi:hypothetical protein
VDDVGATLSRHAQAAHPVDASEAVPPETAKALATLQQRTGRTCSAIVEEALLVAAKR